MKLSVIVPAFNEEKLIAGSLSSIKEAMAPFHQLGWETELIVCDNNSSDCTAELARVAGAQVVFEPINQIARARNCGAAAARGDWLIFVDADSYPTAGLMAEVSQCIQRGKYLAGGATMRIEDPIVLARLTAKLCNVIMRLTRYFAGSFIFCEAAAFRQVGGFSPELYASEEIDLSKKLNRLARTQRKRVVILHHHPLRTSARKFHLYSRRDYIQFFKKFLLRPARTLRSREACAPWYDGRR